MKTTFVNVTGMGIILLVSLLLVTNPLSAQQDKNKDKQHGGANREKMEAQRVAFITQELKLTPDEARLFWPLYNEYDAKRHDLKKTFKGLDYYHTIDTDKLTEKDANQILDNQIIESQKFLDLRKEYHSKFRSVLPAVKVLKLYDAEREFQKILMEKLHNNQQKPSGKK